MKMTDVPSRRSQIEHRSRPVDALSPAASSASPYAEREES
jgi:hypothetical protein